MTKKQAIVQAGRRRAQSETVQELRDVFEPWVSWAPDFGKGAYVRLFSPLTHLLAVLSQILAVDGSCREALRKFLAWLAVEKGLIASAQTAGYCKARKRLRQKNVEDVHKSVVGRIQQSQRGAGLWCGRRVKVVDGSSVSMPDTPANQAKYPQPQSQRQGCGFPVMRIVGVFCLATGVLLDVAKGALGRGERALFRTLWDVFEQGDVVLADCGFCSFADFFYLKQRGVDSVMRNHQRRKKGVTQIERLDKNDRLVAWHKMALKLRPKWLSKQQWRAMPDRLAVRELTVRVDVPGFRTQTIVIATTLLDHKAFPARAFAELYRKRWAVELYLRHIKTTMGMDVLRCKTPDMVEKEMSMHIIAYNLVRALMLEAATAYAVSLERLSLKGTIATLRQWAPTLARVQCHPERPGAMYELMLYYIAADPVPHRPNRTEPRAKKRRPKNYPLLTKPRPQFKEILHRNRYKNGKS